MLENSINQLLAEEKEEGLGKKFPEASETVLEALTSTRAAMVVSLHSSLGKPGVKKHRACLLGPSLWPATSPNQLRKVCLKASRRSLCRNLGSSNVMSDGQSPCRLCSLKHSRNTREELHSYTRK